MSDRLNIAKCALFGGALGFGLTWLFLMVLKAVLDLLIQQPYFGNGYTWLFMSVIATLAGIGCACWFMAEERMSIYQARKHALPEEPIHPQMRRGKGKGC